MFISSSKHMWFSHFVPFGELMELLCTMVVYILGYFPPLLSNNMIAVILTMIVLFSVYELGKSPQLLRTLENIHILHWVETVLAFLFLSRRIKMCLVPRNTNLHFSICDSSPVALTCVFMASSSVLELPNLRHLTASSTCTNRFFCIRWILFFR